MRRLPPRTVPLALDEASVERLLSGTLSATSAPPGYAGVARLLAATVAPPTPRELAGQAAVLAELRAVTGGRRAATTVTPARRRRRRAGLAVVVVVGALATGGVAAATGHLPGPMWEARTGLGPGGGAAQSPVPSAAPGTLAAGSGGTVPGGPASTVGSGPRPGPAAAGPAAGPALDGLCRAYLAGEGGQGQKLSATAFETLVEAAGGADDLDGFCARLLAEATGAKEPKGSGGQDPAGDNPGQGGPPSTTDGGSGQDQGSPPAGRSAPSSPAADGDAARG